MPHHLLSKLAISHTSRLIRLKNLPHLHLLLFRQLNLPRSKVLLQPIYLGRTRNSNHPLGRHPSQRDLSQFTAPLRREFLDLFNDGFVLVEVLALEFWDRTTKVIGCEVIRGLVWEVVDEPAVSERRVGYVGDVEFFGGVDEAVLLVEGFEGGVFGLEGVDVGD